MHERGEHEDDASFGEHFTEDCDGRFEWYPERLEDIGTATPRRVGSVAMLGDAHSRARGNEGSDRRDVERRDRAAAGPGSVDQLHRTVGAERHHRATECSRYAGQFGRRLASGPQPEEQPADLRRCGLAGHNGCERVRDQRLAQRPTLGDRPQRRPEGGGRCGAGG